MKNLRRVCAIAMLSCIFAVSASAGDMSAGRTSTPEEVSTPTSELCGDVSQGVEQAVINIILSLL